MSSLDELFGISAEKRAAMPKSVWLPPTVDPHVHCRTKKTGQMDMVIPACEEHAAIIDIPNVPGLVTLDDFVMRMDDIHSCLLPKQELQVFMTPLINDNTDPAVIAAGVRAKIFKGVKVFWKGVSNDYGNSVSSAEVVIRLMKALREMGIRIPVTFHAECAKDYQGNYIPIKDREWWCVINEVEKVVRADQNGVYVIRHVSDLRTIDWIKKMRDLGFDVHGEISPQYLLLIDDSLFMDEQGHAALQCNCVFWPRPKSVESRATIRWAALSGLPCFHIGTDYAQHLEDFTRDSGVKINNRGTAVGGLNFLPRIAKSVMIDFYLAHGRGDLLPSMLAYNAAAVYGIKLPDRQVEYKQEPWPVEDYSSGMQNVAGELRSIKAPNFLRGHTMYWRRSA